MTRDAFIARYGGIYEHSPWVAEAVWDSAVADAPVETIGQVMREAVEMAGHDRQLTLLRAHPDLAGRLALAGDLTEASRSEQAGAGLDRCTPDEMAAFQSLNTAYVERFRFPFILAVKGHTRQTILDAFRARIDNTAEAEFRTALDQVHRIAGFRLAALDD